jgi:hypothetical protein
MILTSGFATLLAVVAANFLSVFLKAFQQRNVAYAHYALILPTTFALAFAEVYVISAIADVGFSIPLVASVATGGGLGCLLSVWTHERFVKKKELSHDD